MIKLYKDGDNMGIGTDCPDERAFVDQISSSLSWLIDKGRFQGDWEFQLRFWIPQIVDICCKLRGYKSEVHETKWLRAGQGPGGLEIVWTDDRGDTIEPMVGAGNADAEGEAK